MSLARGTRHAGGRHGLSGGGAGTKRGFGKPIHLWEYRNSRLRFVDQLWLRYNEVKDAFLRHPDITEATFSRFPHGRGAPHGLFRAYEEGLPNELRLRTNQVDEDFFSFFGIDVVDGRNFSDEAASLYARHSFGRRDDPDRQAKLSVPGQAEYILNESAVKMLGWTNPVGKTFGMQGRRPGVVVGVVEDFHTRTLHEPIEPMALFAYNWVPKTIFLKVNPQNFEASVAHMKSVWEQYLPVRPFSFSFLDDNLNRRYAAEQQLGRAMTVFASLAIFVACLGLLGLVSFLADRRQRPAASSGEQLPLAASSGELNAAYPLTPGADRRRRGA